VGAVAVPGIPAEVGASLGVPVGEVAAPDTPVGVWAAPGILVRAEAAPGMAELVNCSANQEALLALANYGPRGTVCYVI